LSSGPLPARDAPTVACPVATGPAAVPAILSDTARAFRDAARADVAWLAVRESRSQSLLIRCADGGRCPRVPGFRIEPGNGVGGLVLLGGQPWRQDVDAVGDLSPMERGFLAEEGVAVVMVIPLRGDGLLPGETRLQGLVYIGRRRRNPFSDDAVDRSLRLAEKVARSVRDAWRLHEVTRRWAGAGTTEAATDETATRRLDDVANLIAADVRVLLSSIVGMVFRLDRSSGACHAVGYDGPNLVAVRRGQVLPPGCGSAGRAIALRAPFVARNYGTGQEVRVPPIMTETLRGRTPFTTLSVPLIVDDEVIGALTVARGTRAPYADHEVRLAASAAEAAAPALKQAQRDGETVRRQHGASELSRLAGSLTQAQTLRVPAVWERLVESGLSLLSATDAAVWDPRGQLTVNGRHPTGILADPGAERLQRLLREVLSTKQPSWSPDLETDPRFAEPGVPDPPPAHEHRAVLAVPVRLQDGILAIVALAAETGRVFTAADVELMQGLADQAALAIANARAYHDLEVSRAAVLRHEKLVAVGRLAAGLAHELRNPLQNAVGFIAELRERAAPETLVGRPGFEEFPSFLKQAHGELRRAASIVDRLLDYVRERKPTFESVDLRQLVAEAVALLTTAAVRQEKRIVVAPADAPLRVRADAVMLKQVVLNILGNALDAVEGPGSVEVEMHREPQPPGPGRVRLTVRDTGRGIAPENLPNVFDPFFTTKEVGKGVGLGLAVCQAMIEQHKGSIAITSAGIGQGTTVVVDLPVEP
jgi:signal transduction histidine kinase